MFHLTKLNQVMLRERHVLPSFDQLLGLMDGARAFSKLDGTSASYQMNLAESCQDYATFITPFGRNCFCRLRFGLTPASEYLQKEMARILKEQERCVNMIYGMLVS